MAAVGVPCPPLDDGPARYARWGEQLDVRNITRHEQVGELSAEQVAGYIAKYATKATESFGSGLDRRLTDADDLERLDRLRPMWPHQQQALHWPHPVPSDVQNPLNSHEL